MNYFKIKYFCCTALALIILQMSACNTGTEVNADTADLNKTKAAKVVTTLPLQSIKLPPGFEISLYASNVSNARQMVLGDKGTLFVGSRREGKVYALVDADKDNYAERIIVLADDLRMPSGIAFKDGSLFVGAVNSILRFDNIEDLLDDPPKPMVVSDKFPSEGHHGWKYLGFGPDNKLYVPVGAPCNVCDEEGFAEIQRIDPDGSKIETVARGV